ncbi:hypothetical protein MLD38_029019 [Melastoma candidum]|uniref:Uncharacterized protein n=1 Tax=Melastoma candidum TaxID=119954 RepID=A0ACB9N3M0_9MYRT|nr:hypothetical protein MLD38_029019 [Melastoma candidum]
MGDKDAALQTTLDTLAATLKALQASVEANSQAIQRLSAATPQPSSSYGNRTASGEHNQDRPPRFQKLDFPRYDGKSDPLIFINRCESYFHQQRIMEEEKVWMASYNLEEGAQMWYIQIQQDEGIPSWRRFKDLLHLRYGPPLRSNPLGELAACKRTSTVAEYQDRFQALLPRAGRLDEDQRVQLFTAGLLPPLSFDVEVHNPQSLAGAMSLARKLELREQYATPPPRPAVRALLPPPAPRLALPAPPATNPTASAAVTLESRPVKRLTQAEQEERRRLGLCYNCDEKFGRGHNRVCKRLFLLEGMVEDEEEVPESTEEVIAEGSPHFSLHAIAGVPFGSTMQLGIELGGASLVALLDSGSTHNFISEAAAQRTGLPLQHRPHLTATVANGERVSCLGVIRQTALTIHDDVFTADLFVIPLAGYDVVLGTQWLATLGPILWDFSARTLTFQRRQQKVCWYGIAGPDAPSLRATTGSATLLDELLASFDDVFAEPHGLPPPRGRDHSIVLLPGSQPVAVRPYRYPHHWVGKLLGFDFTVEYKPGATNTVADALSRRDTDEGSVLAISTPRFDFIARLRQAQDIDPTLVAMKDEIHAGTRTSPWSLTDDMVTFDGRLYIPPTSPLLQEIMVAVHENGHEGVQRTVHRLRRDFHFPNMRRLVQDFIRACTTCQRYKSEHLHPAGLLMPLAVPKAVWTDIGLDFVEALPRVGGKSVILTVVDRFSKYCHFIPLAHPYTAESVAQAFFTDIVRLHGVPQSMVSDRDPVFTSMFWQEIMRLMGAKLHMTTAFHPQSDGQSEAANRVIVMYLRCFTGDRPRQWLRWLPWAEYVYNTAYQTSLRDTPFRVVCGRDPPTIRSYEPGETRVVAVAKTMAERDEFLADVRYRLDQAQTVQKLHYDKLHRPVSYQVGDWVLLRLRHRAAASLPRATTGKLKPRYFGPYRITALINDVAVRLQLPPRARLHDVFHVGLLKKFVGQPPDAPPPLPAIHHGAVTPVPERAVRTPFARGIHQVLIHWKGESAASATWEDVDVFLDKYPAFQLEDELLVEGGRDVMWGRAYTRQRRTRDIRRDAIRESG